MSSEKIGKKDGLIITDGPKERRKSIIKKGRGQVFSYSYNHPFPTRPRAPQRPQEGPRPMAM
jgi:hypothetical protein